MAAKAKQSATMIAKLERYEVMHTKTKTNTEPPHTIRGTLNNKSTTP